MKSVIVSNSRRYETCKCSHDEHTASNKFGRTHRKRKVSHSNVPWTLFTQSWTMIHDLLAKRLIDENWELSGCCRRRVDVSEVAIQGWFVCKQWLLLSFSIFFWKGGFYQGSGLGLGAALYAKAGWKTEVGLLCSVCMCQRETERECVFRVSTEREKVAKQDLGTWEFCERVFWCLFCFNRLGVGRKQNGKRQNQKTKTVGKLRMLWEVSEKQTEHNTRW